MHRKADHGGALDGALGTGLRPMVRSMGTQSGREIMRSVFGTAPKRRREGPETPQRLARDPATSGSR
ncbi:hypothetical protein [Sinomonas sp. P10A9]|uniref:Uncharacterized protein n=1 Tax=Sinomonas puerhi TaxID=3238584 RepID=A0AB39L984_9MICC